LKRIEEREGMERYSQSDLVEIFISIFPTIEKLAIDYQDPNLEGQPSLLLKHKTDDTKRMMILFKNRLPNLIKLREQVTGNYNNFLARGITLEITIFVDSSEDMLQRKYREINPNTGDPYIPEYVILKNVREELKLDDKAILI